MKKSISTLLAVFLVLALLTACGNGGTTPDNGTSDNERTEGVEQGKTSSESVSQENPGSSTPQTKVNTEAFDDFIRPKVSETGKLKVGYIHGIPTYESAARSVAQANLEAEKRGWELIHIEYENDSQINDYILNAINQGVDAILLGNMQNMEAKANAIAAAREAGVGIYNNDNQVVSGVISNVTMPNGGSAMDLMYTIGEIIKWTSKICIISRVSTQVWIERTDPIQGIIGAYPGLELLDLQDVSQGNGSDAENAYNIGAAWCTKYGEEMEAVMGACDFVALQANQAAISAATVNPDLWMSGIDGGSEAWYTIREASKGNGYFKYSYAQPFELYTHMCFEIMDQVQVQGLNPGDEGCAISRAGGVYYATGTVITPNNVPESGNNINSAYSYYDAADQDAWFNWDGMMTIE